MRTRTILIAAIAAIGAAAPAAAAPSEPELLGRALLPAAATAPAPFPGAPDTNPAPAPGSTQPVGGFSALNDAPGRDRYYAMPDNGFGSKANSRSFLLRVYRVRAGFATAHGGSGDVEILDWITLRDPDRRIPFRIVNEGTGERLLTGGDLDIESFRIARDGTLWFGEEFGPFLVHTDATGRVLEAPIPLPDVKSPDYPADFPAPYAGPANLASSNGFEGMALSRDGKTLYPTLEGPVAGDDRTIRRMYAFDLRTGRYTGERRTYRVADPSFLVSDLTALDDRRLVALERDNFEGAAARHKQGFVFDLRTATKRPVVDLLDLADPDGISPLGARPGDIGIGDPFSMPYVTIEAVLPTGGDRLAIVNDTNFGSRGRNPSRPDDSDFIEVAVPGLRVAGHAAQAKEQPRGQEPLVIAHRGASAYRPEHTLSAYRLAIGMGADYIEPDLVSTKDHQLVARHENEISGTTDVAQHPEFASRRTTKVIDDVPMTGWFTEDFTLAELKTLRAKERLPQLRPANTAFDGRFEIPTLQEVIDLAKREGVGIYPETKHPTYFDTIGLSLEEPLVATLKANGWDKPSSPVFIQSFEVSNLQELDGRIRVPLVQLTGASGRPYDFTANHDPRTYADITSASGLRGVARYADGLGPDKSQIVPRDAQNRLTQPTSLIADAHRAGLVVHPYTFRPENSFLPEDFREGDPASPEYLRARGDQPAELALFYRLGVDGVFADNADTAVAVRRHVFR